VRYDLAVIGSGGAAFSAAIAARRRNKSVLMIERGTIGGTCINTGCVPSKALLAAAEARHIAANQSFPGIRTEAEAVDFAALIQGKRTLVELMRADKYIDLAAHDGWQIIRGIAGFADGPVLEVALAGGGSQGVEAEHYVIATGSAPFAPPIEGLAESGYLTSTTAMELIALPDSLIVLGGSYVGMELAQLFARLGTRVTIVEILDRLAPSEEPEASRLIQQVFADEGIQVRTGVTVSSVSRDGDTVLVTLRYSDGRTDRLRGQQPLVATGRRPVTDALNLAAVGVKTGNRGEVIVDAQLRTHNPADLCRRRRHRPPAVRLRGWRARHADRRQRVRQRWPHVGLQAPAPGRLHRPAVGRGRPHRGAGHSTGPGLDLPGHDLRPPATRPGQPRHPRPGQDCRRARHRPGRRRYPCRPLRRGRHLGRGLRGQAQNGRRRAGRHLGIERSGTHEHRKPSTPIEGQ
jgi:NADPH-dependent 2,4-dienoyl-CoA reductase/sulfur reductase-like enzyme